MKKIILILFAILPLVGSAQIQITPYMDETVCNNLPEGICERLKQKLTNIISANDIQSRMGDSRFILTANIDAESKDIIASAPPKIAYVLNVNLIIGDGEAGVKYISRSFRTKGVGSNEITSYQNALKNLNSHTTQMSEFVQIGKQRILDYYENNKSKIMASISSAINGKELDRAIYEISLIPSECSYYEDVQSLAGEINKTILDNDGASKLAQAKALWAANQDEATANNILEIISSIDPSCSCFNEANNFIESVRYRLESINNREWAEYKAEKQHDRDMEVLRENNKNNQVMAKISSNERIQMARTYSNERQSIAQSKAMRDIGMAYAKSRPKIIYRINNWY